MTALTKRVKGSPGWKEFSELFEDEKDFPTAICRKQEGKSKTGTLFNIVMDLKARQAVIRMGPAGGCRRGGRAGFLLRCRQPRPSL